MNGDARVARAFHDRTAHSPASVRASAHVLDWDIKPFPFKLYGDLPAQPLPRDFDPVAADALAALAGDAAPAAAPLTLERLAALLYFSAGVTKKKTYPGGGEVLFRAAASTGALFQTEVYVAAGDVDGLAPGLYHFCPGDFALRQLRDGDVRGILAAAAADGAVAGRAATIVLSAIYWRNTWKYQARGYRHLFWDSGTMLANLLAVGEALGAAPRILTGFVDAEVNRLLGLDPDREAALELVVVGPGAGRGEGRTGTVRPDGSAARALDPLDHRVLPLSSREVDHPLLREIHRASELDTAAAVAAWRAAPPPPARPPRGPLEALPEPVRVAGRGLGETIQHRGSTREFSHEPISARELSTALAWATRPVPADVPSGLVDLYLVVNAVEGVAAGAYRYGPESHALEPLSFGTYRRQSAHLTLEQSLGGDAAAVIYFLAPLDALLAAYGNRGYRLANMEAGIAGGRAYLAAYAQRFGATGLTFYDAEVVRFFSPAAAGLDAIFVTALGRASRGARAGPTPLLHAR
jgi:SagB-type dehydrogenase family enzyme